MAKAKASEPAVIRKNAFLQDVLHVIHCSLILQQMVNCNTEYSADYLDRKMALTAVGTS